MPPKSLTIEEKLCANKLSAKKSKQFAHSRSHIRHALSELWGLPALSIPLDAPPGKAPELGSGWGHISISHCCDALLIGWSNEKIGVDIERSDRKFSAKKICSRYYSHKEKQYLNNLTDKEFNCAVLEKWIAKESCIKWQKGSIHSDLVEWIISEPVKYAIHNTIKYKVGVKCIDFGPWIISIASEKTLEMKRPIICLDSRV